MYTCLFFNYEGLSMITASLKKYGFVLSAGLLLSSVTSVIYANNATRLAKLFPLSSTRKNLAIGSIVASILYIMLKTKKTNYNLSMKNFKSDFNGIVDAAKHGNLSLAGDLAYGFFQDYFVGREFKSLQIGFEEITDSGTVIKVKDSKIKCAPFGVVGLFDAYVLKQLEAVMKAHGNTVSAIVALASFVAINDLKDAKI